MLGKAAAGSENKRQEGNARRQQIGWLRQRLGAAAVVSALLLDQLGQATSPLGDAVVYAMVDLTVVYTVTLRALMVQS